MIIPHRFQHVSIDFDVIKKGDFDTKDKEHPGQPKKFENEKVKALFGQDPSQTQEELAESLNVDRSTISKDV